MWEHLTLSLVIVASLPAGTTPVPIPLVTGPPSHGDFVFCWPGDLQIVVSGGLCSTKKVSYGRFSWGRVQNEAVFLVVERLKTLKIHDQEQVACDGSF